LKPPIYQFFGGTKGRAGLVLQVRDHLTKKAVNVLDLECYVATAKIETPFWKITVPTKTKLLLTPPAAEQLLAAGSIVSLPAYPCIPWREGYEAASAEKRKNTSRGIAGPRFIG
jgi:hypothetical protein